MMTKKEQTLIRNLLFLNCSKNARLESETKFESCKNIGPERKF